MAGTMRLDRWIKLKMAAALLCAAVGIPAVGFTVVAQAADSAVILQYHRFGEADLPSTNITLEQFEAHIAHLRSGGYTVLPVPHIVAAIRNGQPLPDKAVGITIDDAAKSVIREAWPRLREAGFPFTLFVATDAIDQRRVRSMSWDDIRTLANAGVTIANHSSSHEHLWRLGLAAARRGQTTSPCRSTARCPRESRSLPHRPLARAQLPRPPLWAAAAVSPTARRPLASPRPESSPPPASAAAVSRLRRPPLTA